MRVAEHDASELTDFVGGRTFIVIATAKAAICAGRALPVMIWSMAQAAWPRARSRLSVNRPKICGQDGTDAASAFGEPREIPEEPSADSATR